MLPHPPYLSVCLSVCLPLSRSPANFRRFSAVRCNCWQFYERALIDHQNAFRNITKTHFKKCIKCMEIVYKNVPLRGRACICRPCFLRSGRRSSLLTSHRCIAALHRRACLFYLPCCFFRNVRRSTPAAFTLALICCLSPAAVCAHMSFYASLSCCVVFPICVSVCVVASPDRGFLETIVTDKFSSLFYTYPIDDFDSDFDANFCAHCFAKYFPATKSSI